MAKSMNISKLKANQRVALIQALRDEPKVIEWQKDREARTAESYGRPDGEGFGVRHAIIESSVDLLTPLERHLAVDLATAIGIVPIYLVKQGGFENAIGVELRPDAVALARQKAVEEGVADKVDIVQSNLLRYEFKEPANLVIMTFVLHFIQEPLKEPLVEWMMDNTVKGGLNIHVALSQLEDNQGRQIVARNGVESRLKEFYERVGWRIERHEIEDEGIHKVAGGPVEITRLVARKLKDAKRP